MQTDVQALHVDRVCRMDSQFEAHCDNGEPFAPAAWWLGAVSRRSQMYPAIFRPISLAIQWLTRCR